MLEAHSIKITRISHMPWDTCQSFIW